MLQLNDMRIYNELYELIKLAFSCLLNTCLVEQLFMLLGMVAHK